jgi:hypothetical protein
MTDGVRSRGFIPLFAIQEIKLKRNSTFFALHMSDEFLHGAFSKECKCKAQLTP